MRRTVSNSVLKESVLRCERCNSLITVGEAVYTSSTFGFASVYCNKCSIHLEEIENALAMEQELMGDYDYFDQGAYYE